MIVNCRVQSGYFRQIAMNWPIVLVLLACFSVQPPHVHSADSAGIIDPAINWLKHRRWNNGWGLETPRVLLALLRNNDTDVAMNDNAVDLSTVEGHLLRQSFDISLLVFLLKSRDERTPSLLPTRPGSLAHYALTLAAQCRNPKDIYGQNIMRPIILTNQHPSLPPFTFVYNMLAICAGGGDIIRVDVMRLVKIGHTREVDASYNLDMLSMVTLTTACLYESSDKFHYLKDFMESPLKYIASQQREDGSFEYNVATTALAIQALDIPRMTGLNYSVEWQPDKALEWLESAQLPDGSFGDIFTTTEVLMALSKRGYATFHYDKCPDPCCAYAGDITTTTESGPLDEELQPPLIQFTYTLWVGQNRSEVYNLNMKIPVNTSFYEAMLMAAEMDPNFQFSANVWPNGHYIISIGGHPEQYIGFHHWLLFTLPTMPDPRNPPEAVVPNVAAGGVDDLYPANGDFYLFWLKNI